jgi:arsenate reductase
MREMGIDISRHHPKGMEQALGPDVALVVGLCAEEACPLVPGVPSEHWPFPDPANGNLAQFRQIRDAIRHRIAALHGRLQGRGPREVDDER